MKKGRWRRVQIIAGFKRELWGYTLWMRDDQPLQWVRKGHLIDYARKKLVQRETPPVAAVNLIAFIDGAAQLAQLFVQFVRPLDEWTDTPPLWDNDGWAQWSEKLPLPTPPKRKRSKRKPPKHK